MKFSEGSSENKQINLGDGVASSNSIDGVDVEDASFIEKIKSSIGDIRSSLKSVGVELNGSSVKTN